MQASDNDTRTPSSNNRSIQNSDDDNSTNDNNVDDAQTATSNHTTCINLLNYQPKPWHHALYHTTVSVLGGSVVACIPLGFAYMRWWGAILFFVASTAFTFYSGWCLIELQTLADKTYSDIANRCMGNPKFAQFYVRPFQMLVFVIVTILNVLVIGWGYSAMDELRKDDGELALLSQSGWIAIGGVTFLMFALIPTISQQWILSVVGALAGVAIAIMVVGGSAISVTEGSRNNDANFFGHSFDTTSDFIFGVFNAFGIIALAYGGHSVLPDIQSSLEVGGEKGEPSITTTATTVEVRRQKDMKKGLIGAYCIIVPCYLFAGVLGYTAFGSDVTGFVIDDISVYVSDSFVVWAWIFLIANAIAIGCVYVQAAFTLVEDIFPSFFKQKNNNKMLPHTETSESVLKVGDVEATSEEVSINDGKVSSTTATARGRPSQLSIRNILMRVMFVSISTLTAAVFPFFADLGGLIGALGFVPLTFVYPLIFWNFSEKATEDNAEWRVIFNWIMVVCWSIVGICGMIGSTYFIIQDSSTYGIFPTKYDE